jgi:hypothetical protein
LLKRLLGFCCGFPLKIEKKAMFMLERFGKVCGWAGNGFALLSVILGFYKWSPGNGKPLYVGVLAAIAFFLVGQALRYVFAGSKSRTSSRL